MLLLGYLPWPSSWHAHVGAQLANTVDDVARYLRRAFGGRSSERFKLRRQAYRQLSDLRTVFQRALAEPARISRRATAWNPAAIALEGTLGAITATAVATDHGASAPSTAAVRQMVDALDAIGRAVRRGDQPGQQRLPTEAAARPVAEAIHTLQELFWRPHD